MLMQILLPSDDLADTENCDTLLFLCIVVNVLETQVHHAASAMWLIILICLLILIVLVLLIIALVYRNRGGKYPGIADLTDFEQSTDNRWLQQDVVVLIAL